MPVPLRVTRGDLTKFSPRVRQQIDDTLNAAEANYAAQSHVRRRDLTVRAPTPILNMTAPQAMELAEKAAEEGWRRIVRAPRAVYACRAESSKLGALGGAGVGAVWVYAVGGYVHAGTVFRSHIYRWKVQIDAQTGDVVGLYVDPEPHQK